MLELPRMKIADPSDFESQKAFEEFDVTTAAGKPLVFKRGKVSYVLGEIRRAYRARDGIFADVLLLAHFKGELKDDKVESVVLIPD